MDREYSLSMFILTLDFGIELTFSQNVDIAISPVFDDCYLASIEIIDHGNIQVVHIMALRCFRFYDQKPFVKGIATNTGDIHESRTSVLVGTESPIGEDVIHERSEIKEL